MDKPQFIQTVVQAAMMYYYDNLTQQEISRKLGTTRQTVSKLLNEAKARGIVEIKIINPIENITALSEELVKKFNITKAITVPSDFDEDSLVKNVIAQIAVEHIAPSLEAGCKNIGISWGQTVHRFIQLFSCIGSNSGLNLFPLMGASNEAAPYFMINEMVRVLAEKTGGNPDFIYIPVNPGSRDEYNLFSRTKAFRSISKLWIDIDMSIVGIGSVKENAMLSRKGYPGEDGLVEKMKSLNAVGDICTNYFDIKGNIVKSGEYHRLICVSADELKNSKRVIALAGGMEKVEAIIGALRTGLISEIVIDEKTAREVLKKS